MQAVIDTGRRVHVLWQVPAYVVLSSAEVLVSSHSVTGNQARLLLLGSQRPVTRAMKLHGSRCCRSA